MEQYICEQGRNLFHLLFPLLLQSEEMYVGVGAISILMVKTRLFWTWTFNSSTFSTMMIRDMRLWHCDTWQSIVELPPGSPAKDGFGKQIKTPFYGRLKCQLSLGIILAENFPPKERMIIRAPAWSSSTWFIDLLQVEKFPVKQPTKTAILALIPRNMININTGSYLTQA